MREENITHYDVGISSVSDNYVTEVINTFHETHLTYILQWSEQNVVLDTVAADHHGKRWARTQFQGAELLKWRYTCFNSAGQSAIVANTESCSMCALSPACMPLPSVPRRVDGAYALSTCLPLCARLGCAAAPLIWIAAVHGVSNGGDHVHLPPCSGSPALLPPMAWPPHALRLADPTSLIP